MVLYCRFRNASAPSLIAAAISLMASLPVSACKTSRASHAAYARESIEIPNTMPSTLDAINSPSSSFYLWPPAGDAQARGIVRIVKTVPALNNKVRDSWDGGALGLRIADRGLEKAIRNPQSRGGN